MTKNLRRIKQESTLWHYCNGVRMDGPPPNLRGDVTDLRGDVDKCGITIEARERGVYVKDLVGD